MGQQLPVFVYGTLRKGYGNYEWALKDRTTKEVYGVLSGYRMYAVSTFPGIVEGGEGAVIGELMYFTDPDIMMHLDRLEGYDATHESRSMYLRRKVSVHTADGPVEAWTYIWNHALNAPPIESGDYADYRPQQRRREYTKARR